MEWNEADRPDSQSWQQFFAEQLDQEDEDKKFEVLAISEPKAQVCYGAYRFVNKNTGEERISALILPLELPQGGHRVRFAILTEYDGPPQHECPREIYDLLTHFRHCEESPHARAWRDRVENRLRGTR